MFQPARKHAKRFGRGAIALAGSHFEHPGSNTMAVLLALGLVATLIAASCQWPNRTHAVLGPAGAAGVWDAPAVWLGQEPQIRVRIVEPTEEIVVGGSRLVLAREGSGRVRMFRSPLIVRAAGTAVTLTEPGGRESTIAGHVDLESGDPRPPTPPRAGTPEHYTDAPTLAVQGVAYAGRVRIMPTAGGVQAINTLGLEPYVAAVASRELYPSWDLAAYEAQTIAARSYALQSMALPKFRDRAWHVESSTVDQAYPGHTTHERSIQAAINTRGRVLAYRGRVLRAYYSSTSGGRSGSAADTWPTGPGFEYNLDAPIQAHDVVHDSDASRLHRWQVVRTADDVTRRLRAWGERSGHSLKSARAVTNITVDRVNRVGRPASYVVGERNGVRHRLSAEQLRIALNHAAPGLADLAGDARVRSGDFEVTAAGSRLVIRGRGFGHGVGMCQFGAQALAKRGWTAEAIVRNYYPGASIERAY